MGGFEHSLQGKKGFLFDYLHRSFVIPVNLSKEAEKDSRRRVIL
jgi:hypothetical protein